MDSPFHSGKEKKYASVPACWPMFSSSEIGLPASPTQLPGLQDLQPSTGTAQRTAFDPLEGGTLRTYCCPDQELLQYQQHPELYLPRWIILPVQRSSSSLSLVRNLCLSKLTRKPGNTVQADVQFNATDYERNNFDNAVATFWDHNLIET